MLESRARARFQFEEGEPTPVRLMRQNESGSPRQKPTVLPLRGTLRVATLHLLVGLNDELFEHFEIDLR